jgi:hypothetical protein
MSSIKTDRFELKSIIREIIEEAGLASSPEVKQFAKEVTEKLYKDYHYNTSGVVFDAMRNAIAHKLTKEGWKKSGSATGVHDKFLSTMRESVDMKWNDGVTIKADVWGGKPVDPSWKSLGHANGWSSTERSQYEKIKNEKWYRIVSNNGNHEVFYAPNIKVWYEVDSSG